MLFHGVGGGDMIVAMFAWPGDEIRGQLGDTYFLLPVRDRVVWHCNWCRRRLGPERIEQLEREQWAKYAAEMKLPAGSPRPPLEVLPCERREYAHWPSGVRWIEPEELGLPCPTLPDGRTVMCIPEGKDFGNILRGEWSRILAAARRQRGPLVAHAYLRTLENLDEWKRTGADLVERSKARVALGRTGVQIDSSNDPFPDINQYAPLMAWVNEWVPELEVEGVPDFKPFRYATEVLSKVLGFAPRTIEKIIGDEGETGRKPKASPVAPKQRLAEPGQASKTRK